MQEYLNNNLDQISKVTTDYSTWLVTCMFTFKLFQVRENLEKLSSILVSEKRDEH